MTLSKLRICYPTDDPEVKQEAHPAVCITKPMAKCQGCPNSTFTLRFLSNIPETLAQTIQCPRWNDLDTNGPPDYYVTTQKATCVAAPYVFCRLCPYKNRTTYGVDITKDGWLGRARRLREQDINDNYVGRLEE